MNLVEVALAGLLHDVGKLLRRGSWEFGEDFLTDLGYSEAVREAAVGTHGQSVSAETRVIYAAGNLASSFRREEPASEGSNPEEPPNSIFSSIRLGDNPRPRHAVRGLGVAIPTVHE